jgi:hypothetical protein
MNLLFEHAQLQRHQHLLRQVYQARLYALCTPCVETVGGLFTCSNYCALARVTRSTPASAFSYRASTNKSDERRFK